MKFNKSKIFISLGVIVGLAIGLTFSPHLRIYEPKVCIDTNCFNVEIANTPKQREQGLMNIAYLEPKSGMLFVFDKEDKYTFWMKNTLIPLDMIRIDKHNTIVEIQTATPCATQECETYGGSKPASYVLEINAGLAKKGGLQTGQKISMDY